jgi:hypothetical protein
MNKMKSMHLIAIAAFSIGSAWAAPVGIATGAKTGTNFPVGEDIVRVCSTTESPISNVITAGGEENVYKVYNDKDTQYAIVPEDTLVYLQGVDKDMMERVVKVFPLFSAELHLVARPSSGIKTLADLQGKRVIEGPKGSATWITVQVIKAATGLTWGSMIASQGDGLKAVLAGQADAMWVVAGTPITMFEPQKSGLQLIPVEHPGLDKLQFYKRTMIPSNTYPFQAGNIYTYKVNNMLATYSFKNQYQKEIGELVSCITRNIGVLRSTGHPKWRDIDPLDIDRIKWPSHPAAVAAIKRELAKQKKGN